MHAAMFQRPGHAHVHLLVCRHHAKSPMQLKLAVARALYCHTSSSMSRCAGTSMFIVPAIWYWLHTRAYAQRGSAA